MFKYRTSWDVIERREVVREAEKVVFLMWGKREVREAKRSDYQNWFDTWQEAHDFMVDLAEGHVEKAQVTLQRAYDKLERIKEMKPPVNE